ncbi:MAG TPA: hypothetical protein VF023_06630 [Bryobacteraceae bacterium]
MKKAVVWALPLLLGVGLYAENVDLSPRVGAVEIYGARKVPVRKIRAVLGVSDGSPLPPSKEGLEEKLDKIPGVVASRLEATCCLDGKSILYVGIEERGSPHFEYRPEPDGDITLPTGITDLYSDFLAAVDKTVRTGQTGESLNPGYSVMQDPAARQDQLAFIPLVKTYLETVHRVVRTSHDADQRAIAAYILQYGPRSPRTTGEIVNDLQYALQDGDDSVRANAIRSLTAMYVGSKLHPEQAVSIQPTWFVELLNSIVWSDRHNAAVALVDMTEDDNQDTLELIRQRALPSVVEMARWRDLSKALPAFILAGRLAGMSKKEIDDAWVNPESREVLLKAALKNKRHKSDTASLFR